MFWLSRDGKSEVLKGSASELMADPRFSPDGSRVGLERGTYEGTRQAFDIWTYEPARNVMTRVTFGEGNNQYPAWSPDGRRIAYVSDRDGSPQIYVKDSSGTGQGERLTNDPNRKFVGDWSRDGRYILYEEQDPKNGSDVLALPVEGDRKPIPILHTQFSERYAQFSPDGKWIAYSSNESGGGQIYIQPFPPSGGKWQVSNSIGFQPRWRGDGKELYFRSAGQV
jgi:Tol biopolymer transport system component